MQNTSKQVKMNIGLKKEKILGIRVTVGGYGLFLEEIILRAKKKISLYICVANVHMLMEGHYSNEFLKVINGADIVTPDGMPLAIGIKMLHGIHQDRVAGMDLLPDLLLAAEKNALKVFFYGGTPEMQKTTEEYVGKTYPQLKTTGFHSPPFRPLTQAEEQEVIQTINDSDTNLVFVALGCPKQEKWMAAMKGRINACMIGIGGALPVMVGMQKRAPQWMQKFSLEWLYRLYQEPGRLWKRYLYTNSLFLILFAKEYFRVKVLKKGR